MKDNMIQEIIDERIASKGDFNKVIDQINIDKYVKDNKKHWSMKKSMAITLTSLTLVTGLILADMNMTKDDFSWEIIEKEKEDEERVPSGVYVPRWDEKNIIQKYPQFTYETIIYEIWDPTYSRPIDEEYIGEYVGTCICEGIDEYEEDEEKRKHITNVNLYTINNIDSDFALAVRFVNDKGYENIYYGFVNWAKEFNSLNDMMNGINFRNYVSFKQASYTYIDKKGENHKIKFDDYDDIIIWDTIFDNVNIPNAILNETYTKASFSSDYFSIRYSFEALGISDSNAHFIAFDKDGYMYIRICPTNKYKDIYYIGQEKVEVLINYFVENVKGYEIVYVDKTPTPDSSSSSTSEPIIMSGEYNPQEE